MKKNLRWIIPGLIVPGFIYAGSAFGQLSFTNTNSLLSFQSRSGCAVTVVDVNNDGMDDIVRLEQGHLINLELQTRDGDYVNHYIDDIGGGSAWAMTMADVDHNGWKDVIADGNGGIHLVKIFENAGTISSTNTILGSSGFFLQNATFCDINNDGWIDLFCCDDNDAAKLYLNDGTGNLLLSSFVNFAVNPGVFYNGDPADSGNYGSTWIDFDNDGDLDLHVAHCRQSSTSPTDLRRINRLFVNDGNNNFTEAGAQYGIAIGWQTWTSSFGDIDNDGDLDLLLTNHDHTNQIFENDGTGHFTELLNTGVGSFNITPIESQMEDFDNDGYIDILIAGSEWLYFKNNGNRTFTRVTTLFANNGMLSFASGDLNHDGFVDIFASYGDIYQSPSGQYDDVLYLNDGNANNFMTFDLEGTISDKNAIGARVTLYGPWGVQIREVRAGESYGTCNSSLLHFGLGTATTADSAVVWFPSGSTTTLTNLAANQFVTVTEGSCTISGNVIPGPYILCSGQTMNLNAAAGFSSYLWNDALNSTTQSIMVAAAGSFNVMVTDNTGCTNLSPTVHVLLNPDETPTVAVTGDLTFCEGGSVTLTSTPASSYTWTGGGSNQSLTVTQSGTYDVTIQGVCGQFTSDPVTVTQLDAPEPVGTGASGPSPSSLLLSATGSNLSWYDQQSGGTLLGTGPTYQTPLLNTTTTYWVESATDYPGAIQYTGQTFHEGSLYSGGSTTNGSVDFDVLSPCTLVSVKVYTDTPGNREVILLDGNGTTIQNLMVNVPMDSSRIVLNFPLAVGTGYSLTTNAAVNQANLGTTTPRLQRSSMNVSYPYMLNNVTITGSNQGGQYYYYFYDWEVQDPTYVCVSDRVPVIADITTGIAGIADAAIKIYPNPASYLVNIELPAATDASVMLLDVTGRVVRQSVYSNSAAGKFTFDLNGIAKGSYNIRIKTANGETVRRLSVN